MRNGWPVLVNTTSLVPRRKGERTGQAGTDEGAPCHADGIAEDGNEVRAGMRERRDGIGVEDLEGHW